MPAKPQYRNRAAIRSGKYTGAHLQEAFDDLQNQIRQLSLQGNLNPTGPMAIPQAPTTITVTPNSSGFHAVQIEDNNPVNRGVVYHVEWSAASDPQFNNPQVAVANTPYRTFNFYMGNQGAHYRVVASYAGGAPSEATYFGTAATPTLVQSPATLTVNVSGGVGTGTAGGPTIVQNTGSGTEPSVFPRGGAGFGFDAVRPSKEDLE